MDRRFFTLLVLGCLSAVTSLAPLPVYAAGNGNGNEQGKEEKEESREEKQDSKEEQKEEKSEERDSGKGNEEKGGQGQDKGDKAKDDRGAVPAEVKVEVGKKDQDAARRAVEANEAIPLKDMLEIFESYGDLTVVDVALVRRNDQLAYRFKFIDPKGRVRQAYFDARSGQQVR